MERGRSAGRQQGLRGGGSGPRGDSGGAALGGERRPQLGDWGCKGCGFHPNFSRRRNCFECGRPRSPRGEGGNGARGNGGGLSRGPIGAGGLRPMLGRGLGATNSATNSSNASAEQRAPTFRVPGASVAAKAAAATAVNGGDGSAGTNAAGTGSRQASTALRSGSGHGGATGATVNTKTTIDAEGFQTVTHRRGWRKGRAVGTDGDDDTTTGPGDREAADAGSAEGGLGDGADVDDDADETAPTASELHQAWHAEVAVVKQLRRQGIASDHPAMEAACKARDDAERAWRDSKDPTPPSVRLSRAQAKLDRGISLQAESRQAIIDLEKAHRAQMAVLQGKLDEDAERVRARRQQLEIIQDEIATGGRGSEAKAVQGDAVRKVHTAICGTVAPVIAALIEQLDSSSPAWTALNGILGTLADSKSLLEKSDPASARGTVFRYCGWWAGRGG